MNAERIRLDPEERKARIRAAARSVFAANGYNATGLVEVAEHADVSKGLVYHYYAAGRPELYVAVMDELYDELLVALAPATRAQVTLERKVALFIDALFDFFEHNRDALGLLFRDAYGSGEALVIERAQQAQLGVAGELGKLVAQTGAPGSATLVITAGTVGFLFEAADLLLRRHVDADTAKAACLAFVTGGFAAFRPPTG